jgi:hypothetical protein
MLAAVALVAGLFGPSKPTAPTIAPCPTAPMQTFATTLAACPALEISGRIDPTGVVLDPAFDVVVPPAELARASDSGALLAGFTSDGRRLFVLPIAASGPFHLYVPLAPFALQAMARITLASPVGATERIATSPAEATAEIISIDDRRVIVAWDAVAFPAIRMAETPEGRPIAYGTGVATYEQTSVDTRARIVYLTFSNGVRSVARAFTIFGR